jgi:hypothetical protein
LQVAAVVQVAALVAEALVDCDQRLQILAVADH